MSDQEAGLGGFSPDEITQAVKDGLGVFPDPIKPAQIYAQYSEGPDQRCTALFYVPDHVEKQIVVKANSFKFLNGSVAAHCQTSRHAPSSVCKVLESSVFERGSILMLQVFEGETLNKTGTSEKLGNAAEVLATIQRCIDGFDRSDFDVVSVESIEALHHGCVDVVKANFEGAWELDHDGKIAKAMGTPAARALDILGSLEPELEKWIGSLLEIPLPLTIDHGDCHSGNVVELVDGGLKIFDWENASVSHPFFSVEKLLTSGWSLDTGTHGGPWGYFRETPTQDIIRTRYLEAWRLSGKETVRAFNAAMCLAVIKEMAHEMEWARVCGWDYQNPEWTAQLIRRLLEHKARFDREF